jgi:DNA primase
MADQVEEVKLKTDIVSLIGEYIPLKKAGKNYRALCPFHSEKTPSFMVSAELQMYKCFGCGEGGDAFTFLQRYEGMDFAEALRFLADRAGVELVSFKPSEEGGKETLFQMNSLVSKFYHYILLNHPSAKVALAYLLKDRGLKMETIKTFQLGYSPDASGILNKFLIEKKKFHPKEIERSGLFVFKNGRVLDRFGGRIIFPLYDHRGNIAGFAGRVLPHEKILAKYINSPETPVYHKSNLLYGLNLTKQDIKKEGEANIVEGELDMISSWQAGVTNTVAIKGSALTEEQVRLLWRFTKNLTMALDADIAGDAAARRGIVIAQRQGLEVKVARLGKFKDPDDAARTSPGEYRKILEQAVGVWDYIIASIFSKADAKTGQGKARISKEIIPVLTSIPDKIVQAHYVEVVARRLGVPTEAVSSQISQMKEETPREKLKDVIEVKKIEKNRRQLLEERLLTLTFQSEPEILLEDKFDRLISTPLPRRIFEEYKSFAAKGKTFSPSGFAEGLPKELMDGFAEMVLRDIGELVVNPDVLQREQKLVIRELEIAELRRKLEVLGVRIRQYEEDRKLAKLKSTQKKFGELSLQLSKLEEESERGIIFQEA